MLVQKHYRVGLKKYGEKIWKGSYPLYTWKSGENKLSTKISSESDKDIKYFVSELIENKIKHYEEK
jgi:hypothetical protein